MANSVNDRVVLTGMNIFNGATTKNTRFPLNLLDVQPFQMVPVEEKNEAWIKWNADFFESLGYRHVKKYGRKKIKNRWLAAGILDHQDYLLSPEYNNFSELVGIIHTPDGEHQSPLELFYPVVPNVLNVLKGEFLKRDTEVIIKGVDEFSVSEFLEQKESQLQEILVQKQMQDKMAGLAKMGISQDSPDPKVQDQFQQEMQQAQQIAQVEAKSKTFRGEAEKWSQHVLNIDRDAKHLDELEVRQFEESLINAEQFWHIDLKEDEYEMDALDGAYCFYHMSPKLEYVSKGDYFGWFDWYTVGDIINRHGTELSDIQIEGLKTILSSNTGAMIVPDMWKSFPSMYYDTTKKYPDGRTDPALNDAILERNLRETFKPSTNFGITAQELLTKNADVFGQPHMFRVMTLYWRSQRKVGFLTKINKVGEIVYADWVDENFKVTEQPDYDNSLIKSKTKYNLVYGEHVDWTYVNEWRRVIKINSNMSHTFWQTNNLGFNPIYLDGKPTKFQFKGDTNPYGSEPPIEGRVHKYWGVRPTSLVDRLKPWQIVANIAGNKIPKILAADPGIVLAINKGMIPRNFSGKEGVDPKREMMDDMMDTKILEYEISREQLELPAQASVPQRVDLSLAEEAVKYGNIYRFAKQEALETVGISMQRLGETKASETLGGNQSAISYSETQTEPLFNQHSNEVMPRVIGKMIEAAQFYCSTKESARAYYMNDQAQNVWIEIEGTKTLARQYHIYPTAKPRTKQMLQELKQLIMNDNTMGASLMEKVSGIVSNSIPEYLRLLKESETKRLQLEDQKFQQEQSMEQQKLQQQQALEDMKEKFQHTENELNRQSAEKIAMIRAEGGIQTDNNKDGQLDAAQNLAILQKQYEADNSLSHERTKTAQEQAQFDQQMQLEREKMSSKERIESLKAKTAIKNKVSGEK